MTDRIVVVDNDWMRLLFGRPGLRGGGPGLVEAELGARFTEVLRDELLATDYAALEMRILDMDLNLPKVQVRREVPPAIPSGQNRHHTRTSQSRQRPVRSRRPFRGLRS